jgi:hypothetical protein
MLYLAVDEKSAELVGAIETSVLDICIVIGQDTAGGKHNSFMLYIDN